ncbi:MAG: hypothetical protein NT007_17725 [Candidatus Kapabacteria bacterium]|nr:hypothetical protein [Candidatus Kapabacteria bacterium]
MKKNDFEIDALIKDYKKLLQPVSHTDKEEKEMIDNIIMKSKVFSQTQRKLSWIKMISYNISDIYRNIIQNFKGHRLRFGFSIIFVMLAVIILLLVNPFENKINIANKSDGKMSEKSIQIPKNEESKTAPDLVVKQKLKNIDLAFNSRSNEIIDKPTLIAIGKSSVRNVLTKNKIRIIGSDTDQMIATDWFRTEQNSTKLSFNFDIYKMNIEISKFQKSGNGSIDQKNTDINKLIKSIKEEIRYKLELLK